jgi:hypothetical protein
MINEVRADAPWPVPRKRMTPIQMKSGAYRMICSRLLLGFWFRVSSFKLTIVVVSG